MRVRGLILPTIAVLFAFGMGIALGAGPLHGVDAETQTGPPTSRITTSARFPEAAISAAASTLYAGGLTGQSVAIVSLPGATGSTTSALRRQIEAAGGTIASSTVIGVGLTAPANKALVDTLGTELAAQLPGITSAKASTYARIGELLGDAIATTSLTPQTTTADPSATGLPSPVLTGTASATGTPTLTASPTASTSPTTPPTSTTSATGSATGSASGSATGSATGSPTSTPTTVDPSFAIPTIRESLQTAGLTSKVDQSAALAPMVVVVTGRRTAPPIVSGLVAGIASKAHNVVALGRTRNPDLASLRTAKVPVVTIDGDEYAAGRTAAVLALIKQLTSGSFGASGIDGALPLG